MAKTVIPARPTPRLIEMSPSTLAPEATALSVSFLAADGSLCVDWTNPSSTARGLAYATAPSGLAMTTGWVTAPRKSLALCGTAAASLAGRRARVPRQTAVAPIAPPTRRDSHAARSTHQGY